ncbi:flavodoxin domain-containing protein [Salisediminibacterium beveridgei]|uniref:Flavodoxin-Like Protein n=1 Tax=Salisediminibacterium beveridgei TaxID=632773 RepID=A0A1D7QVN1_9BACI|nr:flavodoxin domain-containing protein [Salisediminibacterium beveridgei]AOM83018.1 Flavodoxin-Like Protein [Salisediminibacterium beveridgei]
MRNLIVYCSTHGTVKKIAEYIRDTIPETEIIDLEHQRARDIEEYDSIIIGASVHMGLLNRHIRQFVSRNETLLLEKKLGIILCCMHEDMQAQLQFENSFPETLRSHATATAMPGGELQFSKMNYLQRMIVKKVTGTDQDQFTLDHQIIESFIQKMKDPAAQNSD